MRHFVEVARVHSFKRPDMMYVIKRELKTMMYSCNCPSWIFKKGESGKPLVIDGKVMSERTCKHLLAFFKTPKLATGWVNVFDLGMRVRRLL